MAVVRAAVLGCGRNRRLSPCRWGAWCIICIAGLSCLVGCKGKPPPQKAALLVLGDGSADVNAVVFTTDAKRLVTADDDGLIKIWDTRTGEKEATLRGQKGPITCLALSPTGRVLASGGGYWEPGVRIWTLAPPCASKLLPAHTGAVAGLSFSPDGRLLAIASQDSPVLLWDMVRDRQVGALDQGRGADAVAFSPHGDQLAAGMANAIRLFDRTSHDVVATLNARMYFHALAYTPDGRFLVAAGPGGPIICWKLSGGAPEWQASPHVQTLIRAIAIHPSGRYVVSPSFWPATKTSEIEVWDSRDGHAVANFDGGMHDAWAMAFSPDGRLLAIGGTGGRTAVWEFDTVLPDHHREIPAGQAIGR